MICKINIVRMIIYKREKYFAGRTAFYNSRVHVRLNEYEVKYLYAASVIADAAYEIQLERRKGARNRAPHRNVSALSPQFSH